MQESESQDSESLLPFAVCRDVTKKLWCDLDDCLDNIAHLPYGWNGDRADPILSDDIVLVRHILHTLPTLTIASTTLMVEPKVCPAPEGGLDLEWPHFEIYLSQQDVFVQFGPPTFENKEWTFPVPDDLQDKVAFACQVIEQCLLSGSIPPWNTPRFSF